MLDWKTLAKKRIERYTGIRIYRHSLPRGVDFVYDARNVLIPERVSVVFDVGANIGQSADWFHRSYCNARIFCFEPVDSTFRELARRVSGLTRIQTFRMAIGSARGKQEIFINSDPVSSVNSFVNAFAGDDRQLVDVETLDDFCESKQIREIDLLKVDVEGYEMEVLKGARRLLSQKRIKCCYLEAAPRFNNQYHFVSIAEIDGYLSDLGYSAYGIYEQQKDELRRIDRLYFFNVAYMQDELCRSLRVE